MGVACSSTSDCEAVGNKVIKGRVIIGQPTAGEILWTTNDGDTWTSTTPSDAPAQYHSVSCVSPTTCEVGGYSGNITTLPPPVKAIADTTVDGKITRQVAAPQTYPSGIYALSCPSAEECVGVGASYITAGGMFHGVDFTTSDRGAKWVQRSLPADPGGADTYIGILSGVSCSSTTDCVAAGQWVATPGKRTSPGFGGVLLYSTDSGAKWNVAKVPLVANFASVYCAIGSGCVADGDAAIIHGNGEGTGNGVVIKGSLNGKLWLKETVPAGKYELSGIACASAHCVAVGGTSTGNDVVLVSTDAAVRWVRAIVPAATNNGLEGVWCASKLVCEAVS